MWDEQFEEILRAHLPFLQNDEVLDKESSLRDLGLDSLGMVELLSSLEKAYGVRFLDDLLTMETFATPGTLWSTLSSIEASAA
ncbi:acyl carrier protein [Streptomyces sp. NPDC001530]|uniref:acyl carrier protein n=1 Tax=Streptomyces sp. NPDC001530 TaxID=3364582 RepID=UPI0036924A06